MNFYTRTHKAGGIHFLDRLPVILDKEATKLWLSDTRDVPLLKSLLKPYGDDNMQAWAISKMVNSPANDTPQIMEPYEQASPSLL